MSSRQALAIEALRETVMALGQQQFLDAWMQIARSVDAARLAGIELVERIKTERPVRRLSESEAIGLITTCLLHLGSAAFIEAGSEATP